MNIHRRRRQDPPKYGINPVAHLSERRNDDADSLILDSREEWLLPKTPHWRSLHPTCAHTQGQVGRRARPLDHPAQSTHPAVLARSASIRSFAMASSGRIPPEKLLSVVGTFPFPDPDASSLRFARTMQSEDRRYIFSSSTTHREKACASMLLSLRKSCNAIRYWFMASHACCACLAKPAIDIVCAAAASCHYLPPQFRLLCVVQQYSRLSSTQDGGIPQRFQPWLPGQNLRCPPALVPAARCCWLYRCRSARAARTVLGITAVPSIFRCNASNKSCSVRISHQAVAIFNGDISTLYDAAVRAPISAPFDGILWQ